MTWTILHQLCSSQNTPSVITRCHTHPTEAHSLDDHGSTPLHIIMWWPREKISPLVVRTIVQANVSAVVAKDCNGDTPLHVALFRQGDNINVEVVRCMIDTAKGVMDQSGLSLALSMMQISDKEGMLPLHAACRYCPMKGEVIKLLADEYPEGLLKRTKMGELPPSKKKNKPNGQHTPPPPHQIIDRYNKNNSQLPTSSYELLFADRRTRVQMRDGSYPLHIAIANGMSLDTLHHIIKRARCIIVGHGDSGSDVLHLVDKYGRTPLHVAVVTTTTKKMNSLTIDNNNYDDDNDDDDDSLILEIIHHLLTHDDAGIAITTPDHDGNLPLHLACMATGRQKISLSIVRDLAMAYPGALYVRNEEGWHPVEILARLPHKKGYKEACRWMACMSVDDHGDGIGHRFIY